MASFSYDSIRTNNEEDVQHLSFKPTTISSLDELRTEMNKIGTNISTVKTNWQSRVSSIQFIGNLISGGILNRFGEEFIHLLFNIRDGICCQITELRSGVTKEIFRVLSYLAISIDSESDSDASKLKLKQQIQPFIDYIIPYILKQTPQTILVISHGSNITLRTVIKRIPISKSISHIITNTNIHHQKSICLRVRCMEYLQIIIEVQTYHNHYLLNINEMIQAIILCISDPHPSVRYVARQCVWSLNQIYPNQNYVPFILNKISAQNAKYVQTEQTNYKILPPPIGSGHKVELNPHKNKGLLSLSSSKNSHCIASKAPIRPKSALPSRTHRLALLKKKKKEMALALRAQQSNKRPQTANNNKCHIGQQPLRISNNYNNTNYNKQVEEDKHNENDNDNDILMIDNNPSIKGNATRFSSQHHNNNNYNKAVRIEREDNNVNFDDIITAINNMKLDGIKELTKWLKSGNGNKNISTILLALNGFIDAITMHMTDINNIDMESLVLCINNLILSCSDITIKDLFPLFDKLLRLFVANCSCSEYIDKYNLFNSHFLSIAKSLKSNLLSSSSLIYALSQSIIKPKQKIIWLHFISALCDNNNNNKEWDDGLINYLFNLLLQCIDIRIEYHLLFRSPNVLIIDNIINIIVYSQKYHNLFQTHLNNNIIERLLGGIVKNESLVQILQKYYSNDNDNNNIKKRNRSTFTSPSHQNKRYKSIKKTQIDSMATPPLNMYMTTPAPISEKYSFKYNNKALNSLNLNELNDQQLIDILLSKNQTYLKTVFDAKNALKYLSHRINGNKAIFEEKCVDILYHIIEIMNCDKFILHRNALRILQAICWFYPKCINKNIQQTLVCIINMFRTSAPQESGELALDVVTQFCKIVDHKLCIKYLLPIIKNEIKINNDNNGNNINGGRKIFAALSIFDRIVVLSPIEWLKQNINEFTSILIEAYKYYREPMRSLIYLSIIFDDGTSFLNQHVKEQKIVQMMSKETDFTEWVKSHRIHATNT